MSADVLRRAAALMRERAGAATAGPWAHQHEGLQGGEVIRGSDDKRVARVYQNTWPNYMPSCENAAHIASWHPAVALAVADWLDGLVEDECFEDMVPGNACACHGAAISVARAYLGESA